MVDQARAQIVYFDTVNGSSTVARLDSPEIQSSLSFYAEQERSVSGSAQHGRRVLPGDSVIVGAVGADTNQNLYCFILPVDRSKGALVLTVFEPAMIAARVYCTLPQRGRGKARTPKHLGVIGNELVHVYPDGEAVVYPLA
jgi:hypothetical protein